MNKETVVTTSELIKAFEDTYNRMPSNMFSSRIPDLESAYNKAREEMIDMQNKIKYLEMWKKVKMEFPFVNKM